MDSTFKPIAAKVNKDTDNSTVSYQREKKVFKIIVLGDSNVGKTCLTYRFCEGKYLDKPEVTIGVDFRERVLNISGEEIKLQLWDTAGQERFRKSMVHHYYRNTHAVIIVYDITKMSTFQNVLVWIEECEKHNLTHQVPRILVGNKCDCTDSKAVNTNLAQRVADAHNMPLFETSAQLESERSNIEAIFLTLAHKLIRQRPLMTATSPPSLEFNENMHRASIISITRTLKESNDSDNACSC